MKEKIKTQKGFIPIPIIIIGVILLISISVGGTLIVINKDKIASSLDNLFSANISQEQIREEPKSEPKKEESVATTTPTTTDSIIYKETIKEVPVPTPQPTPASVQQVDCTYTCGGTCYPKTECNTGNAFYCKTDGIGICCASDNYFCNNQCWSKCPSDKTFSCSADGKGYCISNTPTPTPTPDPKIEQERLAIEFLNADAEIIKIEKLMEEAETIANSYSSQVKLQTDLNYARTIVENDLNYIQTAKEYAINCLNLSEQLVISNALPITLASKLRAVKNTTIEYYNKKIAYYRLVITWDMCFLDSNIDCCKNVMPAEETAGKEAIDLKTELDQERRAMIDAIKLYFGL